jgi:hypothetical protein
MALEVLPAAIGLEGTASVGTAVWSQRLVRTLVFTEVTAISAGEVAEAAFVRFLAFV